MTSYSSHTDDSGVLENKLKKAQIPVKGLFLLLCLFLQACQSGRMLNPTPSAAPTILPMVTHTPGSEPGAAETAIPVQCGDEVLISNGDYRVENNTWGKGNLSGWSQCIGIGPGTGGTIAARWTWNWLNAGTNVKGYPEIIFGQKPGGTTTTQALPIKLSDIGLLTVSYDVSSNNSGSGDVAIDIWLTDTPDPATFGVPPITHEVMVWLDQQGGLGPSGNFKERVIIDGLAYAVFVAPKWGDGWEYVAFFSPESRLGAATLDLESLLAYLQEKNLATGSEHLASIEFGNEIATGSGETVVKSYSISLTRK
jgi:hypothetical protein